MPKNRYKQQIKFNCFRRQLHFYREKNCNMTVLIEIDGKVIGVRGREIRGTKNSKGYIQITIKGKKHLLHRLVAKKYVLGCTADKNCVNHIDGNKTNNHALNLEWCTPKENNAHARKLGLR